MKFITENKLKEGIFIFCGEEKNSQIQKYKITVPLTEEGHSNINQGNVT